MARLRYNIIRAAAVLLALVISLTAAPCAFAAEVTVDIFRLEAKSNMALMIEYESSLPDVTIIAPNGKELKDDEYTVALGSGTFTYYIPDAARGQWSIRFDKTSGQTLDVRWAPYGDVVEITQLRFDRVRANDSKADVHFNVKSADEDKYSYAVYAALADENGNVTGKKQLATGSAKPNREQSHSVVLSDLQPYHEYHFLLEVWREEYGIEVSDSMLSDSTFMIEGGRMHEPLENMRAAVDCSACTLRLDWSDYAVSCDEYIVKVYDADDTSKVLYNVSFDGGTRDAAMSFPASTRAVIAELCFVDDGIASKPLTKLIPIFDDTRITMPAQELTSSQQVTIGYDSEKQFTAQVDVNGAAKEVNISGKGSFSVALQEFGNDITLSYSLKDDHVVYSYSRSITLDTTAPMLSLPENDVTLHIQGAEFDITGAAEKGATVTINGEAVTLQPDGTFTHSVALVEGENEFVVNASDAAGNVASQMFIINGIQAQQPTAVDVTAEPTPVWKKYLPLFIAFAAGAALLLAAVVLTRLHTKYSALSKLYAAAATSRNVLAILLAASAAMSVYAVTAAVSASGKVNSAAIFETADRSLGEAYDLITAHQQAQDFMKKALLITGALAAAFALTFGAAVLLKKMAVARKDKQQEKQKKEKLKKEKKAPKEKKQKLPKEKKAPAAAFQPMADAVPQATALQRSGQCFCPNCGARYSENMLFCDNCGQKLDE